MALANDGRGVAGPRWWRHWSSSELGSPIPPVSKTRRVFILRGLEHERNPISILTAVEIEGGRLASVVRFGQPLATASSSFESSPARRVGSQASSRSPQAPSRSNCPVRRRIGAFDDRLGFYGYGSKFEGIKPLFIGYPVPTRRGRGFLLILSLRWCETAKITITTERGRILGEAVHVFRRQSTGSETTAAGPS
jgi:hypothetical protein